MSLDNIVQVVATEYQRITDVIDPAFFKLLRDLGDDTETTPITAHLPLVTSPTPFVLLMSFYCIVVFTAYPIIYFTKKPSSEKKPDGLLLSLFIKFHNIFLAVLSLWMGVMIMYYWYTLGYKPWGIAFDPKRDKDIAFVMWVFYVSKYYEFWDTFIMLIKGNLNQVSFLHVYHHASTCFIFWWVCNKAPGGDAYFCIMLNCWVHTVMYTYYFLTTIIKNPADRKRYLWWGKYLTQFQMAQFFANLVHAFWCYFFSPYPAFGVRLQVIDMIALLALFGHFYIQKYCRPEQPSSQLKAKKEA